MVLIKEIVYNELNKQATHELANAMLYQQMSSVAKYLGYLGASSFYDKQYEEELEHHNKIVDFLNENNRIVQIRTIEEDMFAKIGNAKSLIELVQTSLTREVLTTKKIHDLRNTAFENDDQATEVFLQWFVTEQVSEEDQFQDLLSRLKIAGDNSAAILDIDREMGQR